jgi:hypothetical protein
VVVEDAEGKYEQSLGGGIGVFSDLGVRRNDKPEHALIGHLPLPSFIVYSCDLDRAF